MMAIPIAEDGIYRLMQVYENRESVTLHIDVPGQPMPRLLSVNTSEFTFRLVMRGDFVTLSSGEPVAWDFASEVSEAAR